MSLMRAAPVDGRTTVEAAAFNEDWGTLDVLGAAADINAWNRGAPFSLDRLFATDHETVLNGTRWPHCA